MPPTPSHARRPCNQSGDDDGLSPRGLASTAAAPMNKSIWYTATPRHQPKVSMSTKAKPNHRHPSSALIVERVAKQGGITSTKSMSTKATKGYELQLHAQGVAGTGALPILLTADAAEYAQGRDDDLLRGEASDARHRYLPSVADYTAKWIHSESTTSQ